MRTPSAIKDRSLKCITTLQKFSEKSGRRGPYREFVFISRHTDGLRKVKFRLFPNRKVWVHCSCLFFTFNLEYALSHHGSSTITNCNGAYPHITNPTLKPFLCKHAYAASYVIIAVSTKRITIEELRKFAKNKKPSSRLSKVKASDKSKVRSYDIK